MEIENTREGQGVEQSELLRKQAEAIEIAEKLGPRYQQIRKDDDRCAKALEFARANKGRILEYGKVYPHILALDADNHITAFENDGIKAVEAALSALFDPELGYRLAKIAEQAEREGSKGGE